MESPWDGRKKVCSNGPDHMTKMAAMPIYGKSIKTSFQIQDVFKEFQLYSFYDHYIAESPYFTPV